MNAETILRSDLLDIIFENRNKQYGAYPLRKEYNKRLYLSMAVIVSLVVVLSGWHYLLKPPGQERSIAPYPLIIPPDANLKKFEMIPNKPPPLQKKLPPVATITNDPPRIVPDNQVTDSTAHTVADLDNKAISDITSDGPAATGDNQSASKPEPAGVATQAPEPAPESAVIETADVMPEYPGGTAALIRFLSKNLRVPEDAMAAGQKIRVPVKFVVNKDGILSDVAFLTQTDKVFMKEIIRVMAKMPKWKPGLQQGRAVAVYLTIPVIFDMGEN